MVDLNEVLSLVSWIKDELNGHKAVIGISGGKDSTVAAALCVNALGKDNVIGVLMPNGTQKDINDSYNVVLTLGIPYKEINISKIYDSLVEAIDEPINDSVRFNIPPRLRMTMLYAIAQNNNGRVICTSNASEAYIGWTTKWGDNVGDIAPLLKFTKTDVEQIGLLLNLPKDLVCKVPADGLTDKSDEDNLGFTYKELDNYIYTATHGKNIDLIIKRHKESFHKRNPIPVFDRRLNGMIY